MPRGKGKKKGAGLLDFLKRTKLISRGLQHQGVQTLANRFIPGISNVMQSAGEFAQSHGYGRRKKK